MCFIRRLRRYVRHHSLLCIHMAFARPHLEYADIIYDQSENDNFNQKLEYMQCNAALVITGCLCGASSETLYNEHGFLTGDSLENFFSLTKL